MDAFVKTAKEQIETVTDSWNKIYNKLCRCTDQEQIANLKAKRDDCTAVLKELRNDIKTTEHILECNPKMKEEIAIEEQMRQELRPPQKRKNRSYERSI